MTIVWIILAALAIFGLGRMSVKRPNRSGIIVLMLGLNLVAFRAQVRADLAEGRRTFEAKHKAELKALTLTPTELAVISPQPRKR